MYYNLLVIALRRFMSDFNIIPPRYKRAYNCPECNPRLVTLFAIYSPIIAGKFYRYSKPPLHTCPPIPRKQKPYKAKGRNRDREVQTPDDRKDLDQTREARKQATYAFVEAQIAKHKVSRERRLKSQRDRAKLKRDKEKGAV